GLSRGPGIAPARIILIPTRRARAGIPIGGRMAKTEVIQARIEPKLKAEAERIFDELGLDASDAIRVFYKQVVLRKGLPFHVVIPNEATRRPMRDVQQG